MTVLAEAVLRILESVLNGDVFETAKEVVVVKAVQILANLALKENDFFNKNNSERPVDALAENIPEPLTDDLKSRDASASKKNSSLQG